MPDNRQPIPDEMFRSIVMPSVTISIPMPQGAGVPAQPQTQQDRTPQPPTGGTEKNRS